MNRHSCSLLTRRQVLARAAQGGLTLGALSAGAIAQARAEDPRPRSGERHETRKKTSADLKITDFERSFIRFRLDTTKKPPKTTSRKLPMTLNNVRFPLDARAVLTRKSTGKTYDYALSVSCKTEQVWVPRDVWHQPNADMLLIAGPDEFLIVKRWDKADKGVMRYPESLGVQPERQLDSPEQNFDRYSIDLAARPGRELKTLEEIIATLFGAAPAVALTEYETADYHVRLEYPVKTVNFSERERYYQVDTGPALFPDLEQPHRTPLETCQLAYIAHNCPEWAEFLVCVPTTLTENVKVHHYSKSVRVEGTKNRLIAVG